MTKRRTNVTIDADVLDVARDHALNVSAIAEEALREAGRRAEAEAWRLEHVDVLAARIRRLEEHGTRLSDIAAFQLSDDD